MPREHPDAELKNLQGRTGRGLLVGEPCPELLRCEAGTGGECRSDGVDDGEECEGGSCRLAGADER